MRISVKEAKALTNTKTSYEAFDLIYKRLEKRHWRRDGKTYSPAGMTWHHLDGDQLFHLTLTEAIEGGGCYHSRIKLPLDVALDCVSGNF